MELQEMYDKIAGIIIEYEEFHSDIVGCSITTGDHLSENEEDRKTVSFNGENFD